MEKTNFNIREIIETEDIYCKSRIENIFPYIPFDEFMCKYTIDHSGKERLKIENGVGERLLFSAHPIKDCKYNNNGTIKEIFDTFILRLAFDDSSCIIYRKYEAPIELPATQKNYEKMLKVALEFWRKYRHNLVKG